MNARQTIILFIVVVHRVAVHLVVAALMSYVNDAVMMSCLMNVIIDAIGFAFVVVMTYQTPRRCDRRAIEQRIKQFVGEVSCAN